MRSRTTRSIAVHSPAATEPSDRSKTSTVALPRAMASVTRHNTSQSVRAMSPFFSRQFHVRTSLNDTSAYVMVLGRLPQCLLRAEKHRRSRLYRSTAWLQIPRPAGAPVSWPGSTSNEHNLVCRRSETYSRSQFGDPAQNGRGGATGKDPAALSEGGFRRPATLDSTKLDSTMRSPPIHRKAFSSQILFGAPDRS
jgi:hypothetical protein